METNSLPYLMIKSLTKALTLKLLPDQVRTKTKARTLIHLDATSEMSVFYQLVTSKLLKGVNAKMKHARFANNTLTV